MEKCSFVSNFFDDLQPKAREIDEGIDKLTEIWSMPQLLVGGYGGRTAETNACLKQLWETVRNTADKVEKFQLELEPLEETDQFLAESRAKYEDLKEQCDNIGTVLAEYGYYEEDSGQQASYHRDDSKDHSDNDILNSKEMPDIEVEFTPDLTWKYKPKSKESDVSVQQKDPPIKCIATPVIKSLQSVLQLETLNLKESVNTSSQDLTRSTFSKRLARISKK